MLNYCHKSKKFTLIKFTSRRRLKPVKWFVSKNAAAVAAASTDKICYYVINAMAKADIRIAYTYATLQGWL